MGSADAGADMMPHSAVPATRLIARAFTGTSIWLLHVSQDKCHSCFRDHVLQATASECFLGMVRIAPMSRRRAKCIVSIAALRASVGRQQVLRMWVSVGKEEWGLSASLRDRLAHT